jgi:hypothetical protein
MKWILKKTGESSNALNAVCFIFIRRIFLANGSLLRLGEFQICGEKNQNDKS